MEDFKVRITELTDQLESSRRSESKANLRANELEETATKLTEWNGQLDEKCRRLEVEKDELVEINRKMQRELEDQLLEVTEKRMALAQKYSELEETVFVLKRSVVEQEDIKEKLAQENDILKSKVFSVAFKRSEAKITPSLHQATPASFIRRTSDPSPLSFMEEVELTKETTEKQQSITEIFKASFPT